MFLARACFGSMQSFPVPALASGDRCPKKDWPPTLDAGRQAPNLMRQTRGASCLCVTPIGSSVGLSELFPACCSKRNLHCALRASVCVPGSACSRRPRRVDIAHTAIAATKQDGILRAMTNTILSDLPGRLVRIHSTQSRYRATPHPLIPPHNRHWSHSATQFGLQLIQRDPIARGLCCLPPLSWSDSTASRHQLVIKAVRQLSSLGSTTKYLTIRMIAGSEHFTNHGPGALTLYYSTKYFRYLRSRVFLTTDSQSTAWLHCLPIAGRV